MILIIAHLLNQTFLGDVYNYVYVRATVHLQQDYIYLSTYKDNPNTRQKMKYVKIVSGRLHLFNFDWSRLILNKNHRKRSVMRLTRFWCLDLSAESKQSIEKGI